MQQLLILQQVIDFIDEHIKEELEPENLAKMVGYSPYHFYRIFHKHIGYTLMEYVLKRKLQFALYELISGKKIIEIALDYGFETHAGFTKAFKRCFGSPPSLYKLHCPFSLPQKPDLMTIHQKKLGGIVLQPKMVKRPAFWVAGVTFEGNVKNVSYTRDEPAYWNQRGLTDGAVERFLYERLNPNIHGEYCINLNSNETDGSFVYLFSVICEEQLELPEGIKKLKIPAANYVIFKTPLVKVEQFVPAIIGTWQFILEDWLPQSPYEIDEDAFDFEYYDEQCHYWDFEKIYMEVHIPIKEKDSG
jgi:AraC family transcriptional regulator